MIDWHALGIRLGRLAREARPGGLLTLTVPLPNLPEGLPATGEWFHWRRQALSLTGIGCAMRVESDGPGRFAALDSALAGLREHWLHDGCAVAFSGFAFSPHAPNCGAPLPNACIHVPAVLLRGEGDRAEASFSCATADAGDAIPRWKALLSALAPGGDRAPARLSRPAAPLAEAAFLARGRAALSAIESGHVDKLVLTRSVRIVADRPLSPAPILDGLADRNPDCAVWAAGRENRVFLGASPERLLTVRDGAIEVDALAGTTWTSVSRDSPAALPLAGDKNRREHALVVEAVRDALAPLCESPLCESLKVPPRPEVMRLHEISHLRSTIRGRARPGVSPFDLVARLHPTPAVGGTPTAAALDWLSAHGDARGAWYTGGIGWLSAGREADFAVALRCGLLAGNEATLYSGAGFVAGSDPRQELAETEAKLSPMLAALRAGAARHRPPLTETHP